LRAASRRSRESPAPPGGQIFGASDYPVNAIVRHGTLKGASAKSRLESSVVDILPEELEARSIECLLLTVTTNCNLRCTYCCVSQPWYIGQNLDISRLDHFISELSDYKVGLIQVNGHGETTTVEGWEKLV
jgi:hypothetical protein